MCGRFFVEGESENELLARMIEEAERRQQFLTGESNIARGEVFPASTIASMAMGKAFPAKIPSTRTKSSWTKASRKN